IATRSGAVCYANPYLPTADDTVEESALIRAIDWLAQSSIRQVGLLARNRTRSRREPSMQMYGMAEARVRSHFRS
ncbi:MAG: hypothetical protein J0I57_18330, partial [Hyphomicrobium sp.]|nr:hypothetical protein [Hyphomicrobium sp.]